MNKYPKVNYIGNKVKVAEWIIEKLPIKQGLVLDLFCGGCSMSYALKQSGFCVYSNDILYSSFALAKALIENQSDMLELNGIDLESFFDNKELLRLEWMVNYLYFDYEVRELVSLINYAKTLTEYKNYIFLSLLRRSMIRKIPYSRMTIKWEEIVKFRDEELSYQKYKRRRAYHNQPFLAHIKKELNDYNSAIFNNGLENKAFQKDCVELLDFLQSQNKKIDLVYIDPPYPSTMNNYVGFYGGFDKMLSMECKNFLDFTHKDYFLHSLEKVVAKSKSISRYIAISLNNRCNPSADTIRPTLNKYCKNIDMFETTHIYKVTGKKNKNIHNEILMICEFGG